ncbi:putative armadillo-like helical, nucleotide exchange factor Fes1 [Septoria linicola]|nr:putative armadillo-like helical, nucleotide exchange factor Fes1 [Septoria linicola]
MSDQAALNQLLQWGIENSANANGDAPAGERRDPTKGLNPDMLAQLMGGPSDADRMKDAMHAIVAPMDKVDLENKLIAWDNFEQLIEQIDNANNMVPLQLWAPLIRQLDHEEPEMRKNAALCINTAVQNNVKSQEHANSLEVVPKLAKLATEDTDQGVRKKAIGALSSYVRNFQPGMDELEKALPESVWKSSKGGQDAADMESCDEIIQKLRDLSAARA